MKPNKRRLLKLAKLLEGMRERDTKKVFNYGVWFRKTSCGTTACALGWAATIPEFKKAGLYARSGEGIRLRRDIGSEPFSAAEKVFGLNYEQFKHVFTPSDYFRDGRLGPDATAKEVAAHIRRFVERLP